MGRVVLGLREDGDGMRYIDLGRGESDLSALRDAAYGAAAEDRRLRDYEALVIAIDTGPWTTWDVQEGAGRVIARFGVTV